ncbi:MAG: PRC-barrel domain-containing protein [Ardenticatenaceae bacterium]
MRRSKGFTGKRIISVDNGTDLGVVKDVYFDRDLTKIAGLFLGNEGLLSRQALLVPSSAITLFGQDAILVNHCQVVTNSTPTDITEWVRRDRLQGRAITSAGGTKVGTINDVLVDGAGIVKAFSLAMIFLNSPITQTRLIRRNVVLDIGSAGSPMTIDLAKAEHQSLL